MEALILECNLIKEHRPRYNIMLKDDKSYPYIKITTQEKYPKICYDNSDKKQYNMRPYIDNSYYKYKEFIYQTKKKAYKKYVEKYWGVWDENIQRDFFEEFIKNAEDDAWIIQLNRVDIGFYNGRELEDKSYEICNICIIPEYQNKGIGTQVLKDIYVYERKDII